MWTRRCETKTSPPCQCGQKALHHFMCKWSSLITEPSIRFGAKFKKKKKEWDSTWVFLCCSDLFPWQKCAENWEQMSGRCVSLQHTCCICLFSCIPMWIGPCIYFCIFLCICISQACKQGLSHTSSCPTANSPIIAVNQTLQTHKQTQSLCSFSLLRTHNTQKHPVAPTGGGKTPQPHVRQKLQQSGWKVACQSRWMDSLSYSLALVVGLIGPFWSEVGNFFC